MSSFLLLVLLAQILLHAEPIGSAYKALSRFLSEFPGHVLFSHAESFVCAEGWLLPFHFSFWMDCIALIHPYYVKTALHRLPSEQV